MPHVIVKLYAGRTEQQKTMLANGITKAVMGGLGCAEQSVSVGIEGIAPNDWNVAVYQLDIVGKSDQLYKKPGYSP